MKVTVITPTRTIDGVVHEAISCVRLQQTNCSIEHILVIDSPDAELPLAARAENYELLIIRNHRNNGPSGARNAGLDSASGEIVFFLDADDLWPANYVESVVNCYLHNSEIDCISTLGYGFCTEVQSAKPITPVLPEGVIHQRHLAWNAIGCPSGFSFRWIPEVRSARFHEKARYLEDYLFYLTLFATGATNYFRYGGVHFWYRRSEHQATASPTAEAVLSSLHAFNAALGNAPIARLPQQMRRVAAFQAARLCDRLLRRPTLIKTLLLCLLAPSWAHAQLRRLVSGKRSYGT